MGRYVSGKTDAQTHVTQRQLKGKTRRKTLGPVNVFDLEDARGRTRKVLADFYRGIDPREKRCIEETSRFTPDDALASYLVTRKALNTKTVKGRSRFCHWRPYDAMVWRFMLWIPADLPKLQQRGRFGYDRRLHEGFP